MTRQRSHLPGIQLRIAEAKQKDVGKSRARLDAETMAELKVSSGDFIEISGGKKSTAATVLPTEADKSEELGIVRIDGLTRKNAGTSVGENAMVRKVECYPAKSVSLTPVGTKGSMDREFAEFVRNRLKGIPVTTGDELSVIILGNPITFRVQKHRPKGFVKIETTTSLTILPETTVNRRKILATSYEEIGGLDEEIRRLREIIRATSTAPRSLPEVRRRSSKRYPALRPSGLWKDLARKGPCQRVRGKFLLNERPRNHEQVPTERPRENCGTSSGKRGKIRLALYSLTRLTRLRLVARKLSAMSKKE